MKPSFVLDVCFITLAITSIVNTVLVMVGFYWQWKDRRSIHVYRSNINKQK